MSLSFHLRLVLRATLFAATACAASALHAETAPLDYRNDIAPLLRDYCAGCHNDVDREGELSVETFAALMAGGESEDQTIVVPGDPAKSFLLQTVRHEVKPAMPPKREPQPSGAEVALIARWIEEGAKGPAAEHDLSLLSSLNVPEIAASEKAPVPLTALAVSPDGKLRAVAHYREIVIEDSDTGEVRRRMELTEGKVNALHFSPDGSMLVSAGGIPGLKGVAVLWDVASGAEVKRFGEGAHRDTLFDAELSPDASFLATAGYDKVIRLWEVATGKFVRDFTSHTGAIYDLAFSPDGSVLASASGDSTGKLWMVNSGARLDTLNQPTAEQYRIGFTPDGKFIMGAGADNRIRLWRFLSKTEAKINPVAEARFGHEDAIIEMAMSSDGSYLATSSADGALKLWQLPGLQLLHVYDKQPDLVASLRFIENGLLVARLDGSRELIPMEADKLRSSSAAPSEAETETETEVEVVPMAKGVELTKLTEAAKGEQPSLILASEIAGKIATPGEVDRYGFTAAAGETWVFEVNAARSKSMLDSHIEVVDMAGRGIERVALQAVRDSWLTFRGKDSDDSNDFRVQNYLEMEMNDYLYVNGEVVKLWLYPRGADSGFLVYPGFGKRLNYFETTPLSHPLGQPCYIVRPLAPGTEPSPNGLPVYRLYYENDDDASRQYGKDSKLTFVAPAAGDYQIFLRDVRSAGGENYGYTLKARPLQPDFSIEIGGKNPKISPGSGKEIMFTATRMDDFDGPIDLKINGLPEGLSAPETVQIEPGQYRAFTVIRAAESYRGLTEEQAKAIKVTATAAIHGSSQVKDLGGLGKFEAGPAAKVRVTVEKSADQGPETSPVTVGKDGITEITIHPGETVRAEVLALRSDFKAQVDFGKEDAGRNLPHGVFVDNIGLNGLMIPAGADRQRFFLTAAAWVGPMERLFHLRTTADGEQTTTPIRLKVVPKVEMAER
jgi:Planctomycete cytochrome C/WD domain, G-beta repeat